MQSCNANTQAEQARELFSKGCALLKTGEPAIALTYFLRIQELAAPNPAVLLHAGSALHDLGRFDEAVSTYQSALQLDSNMGEIHNNLGNSLMALGRFTEAVESFEIAARLLPSSPVPLTALATAQQATGKIIEAGASCRAALALKPDFSEAHWNLALNLLLQGNYSEGWKEYEWRWLKGGFTSPRRHTDIQQWDGAPLCGSTILLHAEQGFGDAIQFVRYVPLVSQQGGTVVLECHPQLVSLFQEVAGVKLVIPFGAAPTGAEYQAPLLSLPHIFNTTLDNIPARTPYLYVPSEYSRKWKSLMSGYHGTRRIGLVWAGKSYPDPLRSCRLSDFAPIGAVDNVTFFSLQIGDGSEQSVCPPDNFRLVNLTANVNDFADTAALIDQLDLVISIDTATAHLSAALGRPTWLLLPFAPDWRWLLRRNDSPWYPTMRIFRQEQQGMGWGKVIETVAAALEDCSLQKNKIP
ncbi:MAG: tetratricopeptide repeat-containing glycosyltransferase family protein [Geobacteraceae bacterium]|nr:tetratricopeptide repeat-containing glycosyltransferase family protein [Geobacteraceae bacterium]